jgi:hypothetical protein
MSGALGDVSGWRTALPLVVVVVLAEVSVGWLRER